METIHHTDSSDNPADRYAYLCTYSQFYRNKPKGLRTVKRLQHGRDLFLDDCFDRDGNHCGYMLTAQQPTLGTMHELDWMRTAYNGSSCRADIAFDIIEDEPNATSDWIAKHLLLKWRPHGPMYDVEGTVYWNHHRFRRDAGKRQVRRDLALYADKRSKITGQFCAHLELRFFGSDSVRRAGLSQLKSLLELSPRELFAKHIRLVDFDPAPLVLKLVREEVKRDREYYRDRSCDEFTDRYRATISRRFKGAIERLTRGRAQTFRDLFGVKVHPLSIDVLRIPERLTFDHDNRQQHTSITKLHREFNATQSPTPSQRKVKA